MHPHTPIVKQLLSKSEPNLSYADAQSLLEELYFTYAERNPIDNNALRKLYTDLKSYFRPLSFMEEDAVFGLLDKLYLLHERTAFLEGTKFGARLAIELLEE